MVFENWGVVVTFVTDLRDDPTGRGQVWLCGWMGVMRDAKCSKRTFR